MTSSPHAAAAASARQRIAEVLGPMQQDPNLPSAILDVISGLAAAMGPLFQLERGSPDAQLFVQARTVLQQTLERIQTVDQSYPGVADATGAIAQTLGIIFQAMRAAGLVPPAASAQPAAAPQPPAAPPQPPVAAPQPPIAAPQPPAAPMSAPQPAAFAAPQSQPFPLTAAAAAPARAPQAPPFAPPSPPSPPAAGPARAPSGAFRGPTAPGTVQQHTTGGIASVPIGPNGLPRLESEVGVHSETNFYTDFLGDIHNNGGIFVATFHVLPLGAQCEVLLTFPGNLTAEVRGVVRWKREGAAGASLTSSPGLGIEITQANGDAWNLIERFVRKREPIMHEM